MKNLLIKFKTTGKIYLFSSTEEFKIGEKILIDTGQGIEVATVIKNQIKDEKELESVEKGEGLILRKLSEEDEKKMSNLKIKEREAFDFCQQKIKEINLPMKLVSSEISLDEKKLTFYFIAEDRIDFRQLLSELVTNYHKKIRLQQLGARDCAKMLGGIGPCGRQFCCQTFLEAMDSVTLEMAKAQDMATVGSNKISGACGKLMCCLAYESEMYQKIRAKMPKINEQFETKKGKGKIIWQNVLKQTVLVELEDGTKIEEKLKGE